MKTKWIEIAMKNGAELKVLLMPNGKFSAVVYWPKLYKSVGGERSETIQDALESLNNEIEDDASNQCDC